MRSFTNRTAVVTGAASGIGRALAGLLARKGCNLALVDVNRSGMEETARDVRSFGRRVSVHEADVSDKERMLELPEEVLREHGHVHLLINNAGVGLLSTVEEHRLEDFEWIVGINFWGVVYGCKFFLPHLRREDEAHIVNLSSMFGLIGLPTQSAYCATKFAVRGFSEALWCELRGSNVGVTSVHPGGVRTNIVRAARSIDETARERSIEYFDRYATSAERVAEKIVRAIERKQLRLRICPETYVTDWAKRLFPSLTQRAVAWGYQRWR